MGRGVKRDMRNPAGRVSGKFVSLIAFGVAAGAAVGTGASVGDCVGVAVGSAVGVAAEVGTAVAIGDAAGGAVGTGASVGDCVGVGSAVAVVAEVGTAVPIGDEAGAASATGVPATTSPAAVGLGADTGSGSPQAARAGPAIARMKPQAKSARMKRIIKGSALRGPRIRGQEGDDYCPPQEPPSPPPRIASRSINDPREARSRELPKRFSFQWWESTAFSGYA